MQNIVLIIHLLLALSLIAVVLLQRSEGGGLGMGGGGGGGGTVSSRGSMTALGKLTWGLAVAFICTSLTLTIFAARNAADTSVLDQVGIDADPTFDPATEIPTGDDLLPPSASGGDAAEPSDDESPPAEGDGSMPRAE